jgi:hypothetical protein
MPRFKFQVGQTVTLIPSRLDPHVPAGTYVIQRQLPAEGNDLRYRVKSNQDGHERVVPEAQLQASVKLAS